MKINKLATALALSLCVFTGSALACGCNINGGNEENNADIYNVYQTYVAYADDRGETPLSYEKWLESIKGADGKDGKDGVNGKDGKDGVDGSNGKDGKDGKDGVDGTNGKDGKDGATIVSVKTVWLDKWKIAYYFEFKTSDGGTLSTADDPIVKFSSKTTYTAQTEEEREILRNYGVAEDYINYAPVFPPENYRFGSVVQYTSVLRNFGDFYSNNYGSWKSNDGVDLEAENGSQVFAGFDGTVESIESERLSPGNTVTLVHAEGLKSVYSYMVANPDLKEGDKVSKGDLLGTVAKTTEDRDVVVSHDATVEEITQGEKGVTVKASYSTTYIDSETQEETVQKYEYTYTVITLSKDLNVGDEIKKDDVIGTREVNITMDVLGDHLHFMIIVNGKAVDPALYFSED